MTKSISAAADKETLSLDTKPVQSSTPNASTGPFTVSRQVFNDFASI